MDVPRSIRPGTVFAGRYVVGPFLGQGGAAVVYQIEDRQLGVARALKLMVAADEDSRIVLRRRLHDEARAMARLAHPNVLAVHDVGEGEGYDWVVMDLAEGGSLAQKIEAGPVDRALAVRWVIEVLRALQAAHAVGIVHRDVKPQNILLDRYGHAQLADFGIALMGEEMLRTTRTGMVLGSLAYMAPEQRIDARKVTQEADIYAVGATLHHLLTGASPMDLFMAGEHSERLAAVPDDLRGVVVAATRYEPSRRYATAEGMANALLSVEARRRRAGISGREAAIPGGASEASAAHGAAPASPGAHGARPDRPDDPLHAGTVDAESTGLDVPERAAPDIPERTTEDVPERPAPDMPERPAGAERPGPDASDPGAPPPLFWLAVVVASIVAVVLWQIAAPQPTAPPSAVETSATDAMDRVLSTARGRPLGVLRATAGERPITFDLAGSLDNVTGTVTLGKRPGLVQTPVRGRYEPTDHTLTLTEVTQGKEPGVYTLTFDPALSTFSGRFDRKDTGRVVIIVDGS